MDSDTKIPSLKAGDLDSLDLLLTAPYPKSQNDTVSYSRSATPLWRSWRSLVMMCCFLSMVTNFSGQTVMSSAMVCMIDSTSGTDINSTTNRTSYEGEYPSEWKFTWDPQTQGLVLAAMNIGYYVSQIPVGVLSQWISLKKFLVAGHASTAVFQLLTVPSAKWGVPGVIMVRVLAGVAASPLYAITVALLARWTPRQETSLVFGAVGLGMEIGNMMSFALAMFSCQISIQGGWPFIFYCLGGIQLATSFLIGCITSDDPSTHPFLGADEARYLQKTTVYEKKKVKVPVREMLTSLPVYALGLSKICSHTVYFTFVNDGPQFMRDVILLSSFQITLLFSIPVMVIFPVVIFLGSLSDRLVLNRVVTNTTIRKVMDASCKIATSIAMLLLGYLPVQSMALATLLCVAMFASMGLIYLSSEANPTDLSPEHTGSISLFTQISSYWVSFGAPVMIGSLTQDKTRDSWQLVFYLIIGLQAVGLIFYLLFGSGELQPWATGVKDSAVVVFSTRDETDTGTKRQGQRGRSECTGGFMKPQEGHGTPLSFGPQGEETPLLARD